MTWRAASLRNVACAALIVVAAGCTTTVDSTAPGADSTTTTSASTTSGPTTSSTTPPTTTRPVTEAELAKLLPSAAEIGPGYRVVPDTGGSGSQSDEQQDEAMRDACPDLYKLSSDFSQMLTVAYRSDPVEAARSFVDEYSRKVAVVINSGGDLSFTKPQLEKFIRAVNRCDTIELKTAGAAKTLMTLRASPDNHYGDLGLVMTMDISVFASMSTRPVEMAGHVRMFEQGDVAVWITTVDGFDPSTVQVLAVDYDLAANLAKRLEHDIDELHGN